MRTARSFLLTLGAAAATLALPPTAPAPPVKPPWINQIVPHEVQVLLGGPIRIEGRYFQTLTSLVVGDVTFYPWQLEVHTDNVLQFSFLLGPSLGDIPVTVWTNGGVAHGTFRFVPNDPPTLVGPTKLQGGTTQTWWSAGIPHRPSFLLVNLTGQTVPVAGQSLLAYDLLLPHPQTSPLGVESIPVPVPPLPPTFAAWMQFVQLDPTGTPRASNILHLTQ